MGRKKEFAYTGKRRVRNRVSRNHRRRRTVGKNRLVSSILVEKPDENFPSIFGNATGHPTLVTSSMSRSLVVPGDNIGFGNSRNNENEPEEISSMRQIMANRHLYVEYLKRLKKMIERCTGFSAVWPQDHFSMVVCARRRSGKTTFMDKLVKEHLVSYRMDHSNGGHTLVRSKNQFFKKRILVSPTAFKEHGMDTSSFDEIFTSGAELNNFLVKYKNNPKEEFENTLLVLDDTHSWLDHHSGSLILWFITVNRHYNCSVIAATHNIRSLAPVIRNNASEWVLFRTRLDEELHKIQEAFGTSFEEHYNEVNWSEPFNFLYMTLRDGPTTWFFEGKASGTKFCKPKTFNEEDCTIQMRYLGNDLLPANSTLEVENMGPN